MSNYRFQVRFLFEFPPIIHRHTNQLYVWLLVLLSVHGVTAPASPVTISTRPQQSSWDVYRAETSPPIILQQSLVNDWSYSFRYKTPRLQWLTPFNITRKYPVVCCRWIQTLCLWSASLYITKRFKNLSQIFLCLHKCHHSTWDIFSNTKSALWQHLCRHTPRHQPKSSLSKMRSQLSCTN